MKIILSLSFISLIMVFTGCAMNQEIVQTDEFAYLKLVGNLENLTLQIDENAIIPVDPEKEDVVYKMKPGTHVVTVYKNNVIIVKRKLYFDDKITREIEIK